MEFCRMTLTFESLDEILSNESSLPALAHGAICFWKFHKMKFGNLVEICFWLNSVSDEVNYVLKDTPLPVASHTDVLGIALRDE